MMARSREADCTNRVDAAAAEARAATGRRAGGGASAAPASAAAIVAPDACPSNTHLESSQCEVGEGNREPVAEVDWLEVAGLIVWDDRKSREMFNRLDQLQRQAVEENAPVPVNIGRLQGLLHPRGMGTGKQSRSEYRVECGLVTMGFSSREGKKRNLSNWYLKVAGEACVVLGMKNAWDASHKVVEEIGGCLVDEWCRRVDYCLDLPGVDVRDELVPAFERGQFLTTAGKWMLHDGRHGKTGFSIGNRKRLFLNVYDKLLDSQCSHGEVYLSAMRQRRWGGEVPEAATRVELQIRGDWLREHGLKDADVAVESLGSVVEKTLSQPHAFFAMTDRVPDRENKHQARAGVLPLWAEIVSAMREQGGEVRTQLESVRRDTASCSRLYNMIRGCLISAAAQRASVCESVEDAIAELRRLEELNGGGDEDWSIRWERRTRQVGTYCDTMAFPYGEAA